ncbi:MAG: hypothetical protein AAFY47_00445 [Pseudomonadota bacterium]
MMFSRFLFAMVGVATAHGSPAMACNLHAPGQVAGFHRYNPFASTMQQYPDASANAESTADAKALSAKKETEEQQREARRRQRALEREEARSADDESDARGNVQEGRSVLS